jgi:hypothetical protein
MDNTSKTTSHFAQEKKEDKDYLNTIVVKYLRNFDLTNVKINNKTTIGIHMKQTFDIS